MIDFQSSSSVSQTVWIGAPGAKEPKLISGYLYTVNPTIVGLATLVVRWNDGLSTKQHSETLIATLLGNFRTFVFPMIQETGQDITYELSITGGATVGVLLGYVGVN